MITATLVAGVLLFGGGSLGLSGGDQPSVPADTDSAPDSGHDAPSDGQPVSPLPGVVGLGAMAAALAALARREDLSPGDGLSLDAPPLVVFVPGHGQQSGEVAFADLIADMGIDGESVRHFDYRLVTGGSSASEASEDVGIDDAASALNTYVAGAAGGGRDVYLVGFSKGGATIAEMIADWDGGGWGPARSVVGAALLDPPISPGALGWLQSVGRRWGSIPDDGGFDPVECDFLGFGCVDRRDHLGESSGIDVIVVRNPKAVVTSFGDDPDGLRVYDAADSGPTIPAQLMRNPLALPGRIAEAHDAVLHDREVADCLMAEIGGGRCDLPPARPSAPLPGLLRRAVRAPSPQKVM